VVVASKSQRVTAPLIKLAIFAAVTLTLTALLATTIASVTFGETIRYRAEFTDVTGLLPGDDVRIAGVRVGRVDGIDLVRNSVARITLDVDREHRIRKGTRAVIRYRNLVGQRYIALTDGPGPDEYLGENGLIPLKQTKPALDLTVLLNGFRPLFVALDPKEVNTFAYEVIRVLQGEGGTITSLLSHTASLTNTLADRDQVIGRLITNLNQVLGTISDRDTQLSELIGQLQQLVSGLAADRKAIGSSLTGIADLADATAGLVEDGRPALRADIAALGKLAKTLNDSAEIVEGVLQRMPGKLTAITSTATYGSWFNFFLCDFDGVVALPIVGETQSPTFSSTEARCQQGGGQQAGGQQAGSQQAGSQQAGSRHGGGHS
jgi:phospholipid/cholesterol/gamma-HCH transport system substrate-binding protein